MDHLPQLRDSSRSRIEVPLLEDARFAYDGAGLEGFPTRCGFMFAERYDLQPEFDPSAFFQSWLFFGTMAEVFQVYDIRVRREDFASHALDDSAIITTKYLPDYIAAWIVAASREYPGCLDRDKHYSYAREIADKVGSVTGRAVVSLICAARRDTEIRPTAMQVLHSKQQLWEGGRERAKTRATKIYHVLHTAAGILRDLGPAARGIDDAVWDSVLVLCTTLQTAAFFIYRACPLDAPFKIPFNTLPARLRARFFLQHGWCPREMKIMDDLVEGDQCTLLLCSQLDRRGDTRHNGCNAGQCSAYQIKPGTYRTQHRQECRGCDFLGFDGPDFQDVAGSKLVKTILGDRVWLSTSRLIPMASYNEGKLQLVPMSVRLLYGDTFVAVSHVWADGMGNENENTLPRCQLTRIQDLVNKQFPDKKGPIPFWMDTLCIPVAKNNPEDFKKAKDKAIEHMESIYKYAAKVLVLDHTLTTVSTDGMSPEEIGLRIMCSGWARRLWTLQEGVFQARVHYQFADTSYTYEHLNAAIRQTHAFPDRVKIVPNTHFLQEILVDPPNCTIRSSDPLACFAHKPLSCSWPRMSSFFKELNIRYSQPDPAWFPGMQLVPGMTILVPRALRTIAYRTTSCIEDEGLILASLTSWRAGSARPLGPIPKEERLRACFERFAIVPSQLIFLDQQRYDDAGARWIPKSLLAQSSEGTAPLPFEHAIISDEFSWPSSYGITADYPSFHVALPLDWVCSNGNQRFRLNLVGHQYTCFIHVAGSQNAPSCLPSNLALVFPRSIRSGPWRCVAALVSILDKNPSITSNRKSWSVAGLYLWGRDVLANYYDKQRVMGRHEALVDLERVPEGQGGNETLPVVESVPIMEFTTPEGNTQWRIG